jgi:GxxExxY protein
MNENKFDLIYKEEVYALVGAAMEVHTQLGCGFLEAVYQEALEIELANRNIPFISQKEISITYKNRTLKKTYVADLVAFDKIIIELKAIDLISGREEAQLINYLKASGMAVGLLFNFGSRKLEWLRRANTTKKSDPT